MAIQNVNQGAMNVSASSLGLSSPTTSTYRGIFSDWFNAENIAKEDFERNEMAAMNQLKRDLYLQQTQNEFTERMSNTSYQRAVEDMKKAGLNPVLAVSQGGASTPGAASGSSRGGYTARGNNVNSGQVVGDILDLVTGIVTGGMSGAAKIAAAKLAHNIR